MQCISTIVDDFRVTFVKNPNNKTEARPSTSKPNTKTRFLTLRPWPWPSADDLDQRTWPEESKDTEMNCLGQDC